MQRMAVIDDEGNVTNIILASNGFNPGEGLSIRAATDEDAVTVRHASIEGAKQTRLADLAHRRWLAEQRFTFNGMSLTLDDGTQRRISGALQYLELSGETSVRWQVARGVFTTLSAEQLAALAVAAGAHVQACFANVEVLAAAIESAQTLAEVLAVDFEAGWP